MKVAGIAARSKPGVFRGRRYFALAEQGVNDYALFAICFSHNRDSPDHASMGEAGAEPSGD
jgi:hypothetical protein